MCGYGDNDSPTVVIPESMSTRGLDPFRAAITMTSNTTSDQNNRSLL